MIVALSDAQWRKSSRSAGSNNCVEVATNLIGATWRKSIRSQATGACVEVADNLVGPGWRKSSRSGSNGACVEVRDSAGVVGMRDSKDPEGPALAVHPAAFAAFTDTLKTGRLDG